MALNLDFFDIDWEQGEGHVLIDLVPVGIPVYVVYSACQIESGRSIDVASEAILRILRVRSFDEAGLTSILGVSDRFLRLILSELIRSDMVAIPEDGCSEYALTEFGMKFVEGQCSREPEYINLGCQYDGLRRIETDFPESILCSGIAVLAHQGVRIYPIPNQRPQIEDLDVEKLTYILRRRISAQANASVIRVRNIENTRLKYVLGHILVCSDTSLKNYFLSLYVSGRHAKEYDESINSGAFTRTYFGRRLERFSDLVNEKDGKISKIEARFKAAANEGGVSSSSASFDELDFKRSVEVIVGAIRNVEKPVMIQSSVFDERLMTDEFYELLKARDEAKSPLTIVLSKHDKRGSVGRDGIFQYLSGPDSPKNVEVIFANGPIEDGLVVSGEACAFFSFPPLAFAGGKDRQLSYSWGAHCVSEEISHRVERAFKRQWRLDGNVKIIRGKRRRAIKKPGL